MPTNEKFFVFPVYLPLPNQNIERKERERENAKKKMSNKLNSRLSDIEIIRIIRKNRAEIFQTHLLIRQTMKYNLN